MMTFYEGYELSARRHNSAAYLAQMIEVMRRAYADRKMFIWANPDYMQEIVPEWQT